MARRTEGWTLQRDPRSGTWFVRFRTPDGRRLNRSTGTRDRREAQSAGARIYREACSERKAVAKGRHALADVTAGWVRDYRASHSPETVEAVESFIAVHWLSRWSAVDELHALALADYVRDRLTVVTASTVRKETSALRGFLGWAAERGLSDPVVVPSVPKRATGTPYEGGKRTPRRIELRPATVFAIVTALPERNRAGYPVRDVIEMLWETSLREASIARLERPRHWRPGRTTLTITDDVDKNRHGRELPLSARAIEILERNATEDGPIFGWGTLRHCVEKAALAAGLPPDDARRVSPHDLRHGAITHIVSRSPSIAGAQYLAGHKHASTTALYIHPGIEAARQALDARFGTPDGTPTKIEASIPDEPPKNPPTK
jgi:integrase